MIMQPVVPDFHPGEKYALVHRYWQGCPTVCRTAGGRLFAGWYSGGSREPSPGNYNLLVESCDNGETWSEKPLLVIESDPSECLAIDIQLWLDPLNRMWLFWTQRSLKIHPRTDGHLAVYAIRCDDPDAETLTWSDPLYVAPGFLRCQPTVLTDGRWLLPAYDWAHDVYSWSESADQGKTWVRRHGGKKLETPFDEGMFWEAKDGVIHMFARSAVGCIAETVSRDGGKSWSDGARTSLAAPSSRLFIRRLPSGNLLLVYNDHAADRRNMTAKLSLDDGKTWPYALLLDATGDALSYPDGVVLDDGSILIVYDNGRTTFREILSARFTEEDVKNGELCGDAYTHSYLKKLIAKAPVPEDHAAYEKARQSDREFLENLQKPGNAWDKQFRPENSSVSC